MAEFDDANVGDPVAIIQKYGWNGRIRVQFGRIERVTKTQVTAFSGRRFMRQHGFEVGTSREPRGCILSRDTPQLRARIAQDKAYDAAEIKCSDWAAKLRGARGDDAIKLAAILPDIDKGQ